MVQEGQPPFTKRYWMPGRAAHCGCRERLLLLLCAGSQAVAAMRLQPGSRVQGAHLAPRRPVCLAGRGSAPPPAPKDVGVAPLQTHHCGALLCELAQQLVDLQHQQVLRVLMASLPARWCLVKSGCRQYHQGHAAIPGRVQAATGSDYLCRPELIPCMCCMMASQMLCPCQAP